MRLETTLKKRGVFRKAKRVGTNLNSKKNEQ